MYLVNYVDGVPIAGAYCGDILCFHVQRNVASRLVLFLADSVAVHVMVFSPSILYLYALVRRISRECGAIFAVRGSGFSANLSASGWMRMENGKMRRGRTFVRSGELKFNFKALALTAGFSSVAMVLREEFIIDWSLVDASRGGGSWQESRGVWIP